MSKSRKISFAIIILVVVLQAFFIFKRIHNYPFMIYDMYSRPEKKLDYSEHYVIVANSDTINLIGLPIMKEGVIINSLKQYQVLKEKGEPSWYNALQSRQQRLGMGFTSKSNKYLVPNKNDIESYPEWLKQYLEKNVSKHTIENLQVYTITIGTRFGLKYKQELLIDLNE